VSRIAATRILPRTGVAMPALGLGGAALGGMHGVVTEAEAARTLNDAWEYGIRYFDTAPLYGHGLGELRTGAVLRERPRDDFVFSTKVGWKMNPLHRPPPSLPAGNLPFDRGIDYSFDGTMRSVEDSLLRLGLDRIDLVFVHDVDPYNHGTTYPLRFAEVLAGALPALTRLRAEGIVRAIGVGVNDCRVCLDFLREAEPDCFLLAGRYSLLDGRAEVELLPECEKRGVGVIIGAPFNTGILAKRRGGKFNHDADAPSDIAARVEAMHEACEAHGVTLMAAALQFPLRHSAVVSVLPGPRSPDQLAGIAEAAQTPIPATLWAALDAMRRDIPP
jgi:D-threo-aldose 1-dehydrogenase